MACCSRGQVVDYSIDCCSSFSEGFIPEHIIVNDPSNQKSRWLSDGYRQPQHVTLRLSQPAIVERIHFGKFDKSHPCNLRKLCVYGGMDKEHLHLLFEGGLSNDATPETFDLRSTIAGRSFSCLYIKIVPLQSWGFSFSFSLWYVQLLGTLNRERVETASRNIAEYYETEALRLCLKHLRQHDYIEAFEAIQKKSRVSLEHPLLTDLHQKLALNGDFEGAEQLIEQAIQDGFMNAYISDQLVELDWHLIEPQSSVGVGVSSWCPSGRGGHQMCIDSVSQTLYLHGGWDGSKELGDLWMYDITTCYWTYLYQDTSIDGGPCARSCHQMCLDVQTKTLYFLGRYIDITSQDTSITGDFYCFQVTASKWTLISKDTYVDGGPRLIYDHQMCCDSDTHVLYVFGGKILNSLQGDTHHTYSGLYSYHITDQQWVCLHPDLSSSDYNHSLKPRMSHAMVLHPTLHRLYVIGGQRDKIALTDFQMYNVRSDQTTELSSNEVPLSALTVSLTVDPDTNEIFLMPGMDKHDSDSSKQFTNALWMYSINENKWSCLSQGKMEHHLHQPVPRFAHQLVYDTRQKVHYLFGGNPGGKTRSKASHSTRLDDLWQLKLVRQSKEQLLRHCQFLIRRQRYAELAVSCPVGAISYLQTSIASLVNHDNPSESSQFRQLTSDLFINHSDSTVIAQRNKLYDELSGFFPSNMTQPTHNITDLVKL